MSPTSDRSAQELHLESASASVVVSAAAGGRITSLQVHGMQLLGGADDPGVPPETRSGSFPMAPWAGRLRDGQFSLRGKDFRFPPDLPPHAIHGLSHKVAWQVDDEAALSLELAPLWPLGGVLHQRFELDDASLTVALTATATTESFPVVLGFHPCFRRRLERGGGAHVELDASGQYRQDATGLPDGTLETPHVGPWDDCFVVPSREVSVVWPGALRLNVRSDHDHFVVYDRRAEAVCVEPQTGPPDAYNLAGCPVLAPGESETLTMTLDWHGARGAETR